MSPAELFDGGVMIVLGLLASGGFWAYKSRQVTVRGAQLQLLLGLAHDRIVHLGMGYIERGYITKDEYDDFVHYLYEPYKEFGGNGLAQKIMNDVADLPIKKYEMRIKGAPHE